MKEILQYLCTWKFWKELFIMTLGMAIAAAAVYYFMMPSKLVWPGCSSARNSVPRPFIRR